MENLSIPNPMENISTEDKKQIADTLGKVVLAICFISAVAIPLFFLPFFADPIEFPKQLLVFFLGIVGLLLWSIRNVIRGKFMFARTVFDLPILLLAIIGIVSAVLTPNLYASLSSETLILVGGACFFFLFANAPEKEATLEKLPLFFAISGAILSALVLVQLVFSLVASRVAQGPTLFFLNPGFNPAGSALAAALFLVGILPFVIGLWKSESFKQRDLMLPLLILIGAGIVSSSVILFQNRPILLDHLSGWKIATSVLGESPKSALLGVGPGNIIDAFTLYKPASFNGSEIWNLRFSTSSNFYLSILTSLGIFGIALVILFAVKFALVAKSRLSLDKTPALEKGLIGSIAVILVLGLIFPLPLLSLFLLFATSGILMANYRLKGVSLYSKSVDYSKGKAFSLIISVILLVMLLGGGYFLGRFALADYFFAQSLQAAAANNGKNTYDLQIKALDFNPYNTNYRTAYAQTNLALANSLAGQANLTDEQKQTVVTLVQQAIREGRLAAALAPRRASAWENLSLVYRNLINFAQGADQWAVASQQQAVALDPTNPRLLLDLGGIFFAAKDYQTSAQLFNQAVNLKPDFANAHYNLAQALKGLKQNDLAVQELQTTATLVCAAPNGKADCDRVNSEIAEVNKLIANPEAEATPSAEVAPQPDTTQEPLATPGATQSNLPAARPTPVPQVSSESGELQ